MEKMIPHADLKFGHEHEPPLNARRVGRDAELEALAASILSHGLGQALNVHEDDGGLFVYDGNRRLAAIGMLIKRKDLPADYAVRCHVGEMTADSDELSLALNIERVPMHEADTYQKFYELHQRGHSAGQIASRFGEDEKRVNRMLALGAIHPDILDAWRNDELSIRPVEAIRAFTLAPSVEDQKRVFDKLKKSGDLYDRAIMEEFGAGDSNVDRRLKLIGVDAYKAAGGDITEDLFGENHAVSDPALVIKLSDEWILNKCEEYKAEGWSWAKPFSELPDSARYGWERIYVDRTPTDEQQAEIEALRKERDDLDEDDDDRHRELSAKIQSIRESVVPKATPEQMNAGGVAIGFGYGREVEITFLIDPATNRKAKDGKTADKKPAGISTALNHRLSLQLSRAVQQAIGDSPHTGLAALAAAMDATGYDSPVKVSLQGVGSGYHGAVTEKKVTRFEDLFARYLKMSTDDLVSVAAHAMAKGIDLQQHGAQSPVSGVASALTSVMHPVALEKALADQFDADDFFRVAPKAITLKAIKDALNADEARKAEKLKKKELVEFAVKNVPPTGWLPPELRTIHYTGPGAAKPKKAKTRKAA